MAASEKRALRSHAPSALPCSRALSSAWQVARTSAGIRGWAEWDPVKNYDVEPVTTPKPKAAPDEAGSSGSKKFVPPHNHSFEEEEDDDDEPIPRYQRLMCALPPP